MRYLLVRWRDSAYSSGTFDMAEAVRYGPIQVETVGHLVAEHDDRITLASEYYEEEKNCRHLFTIPRVNIEEVFEMEHGKHMMKGMPKGHGPKMMGKGMSAKAPKPKRSGGAKRRK